MVLWNHFLSTNQWAPMAQTQGLRAQGVAWIVPVLFSAEIPTAFLERGSVGWWFFSVGMGEDSGFPEIFGMLPPYCTLANHYLAPWNVPRDFEVYLGLTSLFQGEI